MEPYVVSGEAEALIGDEQVISKHARMCWQRRERPRVAATWHGVLGPGGRSADRAQVVIPRALG